jgi:hypothetical protein
MSPNRKNPEPSVSRPDRRGFKRNPLKKRAGLLVRQGRQVHRIPCLILDNSLDGFRIGGTSLLKRGQEVELILDENTSSTERCSVRWIGRPASKQAGEAGLQIKPARL